MQTNKPRELHWACELFPRIHEDSDEMAALIDDIRTNGLREKIWVDKRGRVLDGRNRVYACAKAGVICGTRTFKGKEPEILGFVMSQNMHRRHLSASQIAAVWATIQTRLSEGKSVNRVYNQKPNTQCPLDPNDRGKHLDEAKTNKSAFAEQSGISRQTIQQATAVIERGDPELVQAVIGGKVSAKAAAATLKKSPEHQRAVARGETPPPDPKPSAQFPRDNKGNRLTDEIGLVFEQSKKLTDLMKQVRDIQAEVKAIAATDIGRYIHQQSFHADTENAFSNLKFARPFALCPYCSGARCNNCKQVGWMPKEIFERVPKA